VKGYLLNLIPRLSANMSFSKLKMSMRKGSKMSKEPKELKKKIRCLAKMMTSSMQGSVIINLASLQHLSARRKCLKPKPLLKRRVRPLGTIKDHICCILTKRFCWSFNRIACQVVSMGCKMAARNSWSKAKKKKEKTAYLTPMNRALANWKNSKERMQNLWKC